MSQLPRVLVVDDETENLKAIQRCLNKSFYLELSDSPKVALKTLKTSEYSVIISDQRMPEMKGTDFLFEVGLLQPMATRILLTAYTEVADLLDAINKAGIFRFISKPWDPQELLATTVQAYQQHQLKKQNENLIRSLQTREIELKELNESLEDKVHRRTQELELANEQLKSLASTDPLTRLLNRREFYERCHKEIERAKRYSNPLSLAMIDVDNFKDINDTHGHLIGDTVLKSVGKTLTQECRAVDIICRFGGEEFSLLLPETVLQSGFELCERLRKALDEDLVALSGEQSLRYTVSIGVSSFPQHGSSMDNLILSADQALYHAKKQGKNQVVRAKDKK